MATTRAYYNSLIDTRNQICIFMGSTAGTRPNDMRALCNSTLAAVAIVVKALTDNGVITDAQLLAAKNAALADLWDIEQPTP